MNKKIEIAGMKFEPSELVVYGGTVLFIICSFLSFIHAGSKGAYFYENYNFIFNGGIIAVILLLVSCVTIYLKFEKIALGTSALAVLYTAYSLFFGITERESFVHISFTGIITLIVCVLVCIATYKVYNDSEIKKARK